MEEQIEQQGLAKSFVKSGLWNFLTSIIIRLGALIFTIIIARMLQPELFGLYSLALSVMFILITFADLGINATMMRYVSDALGKGNKKKATSYFSYLLRIKFFLTLAFSVVLLIASYPLANYVFNKPDLFMPLIFCSFYMLFLSFVGFYESTFYTVQKVKFVTLKEAIYQILKILLTILGVYLIANKVVGAMVGLIISTIFTLALLVFLTHKTQGYLFEKSSKIADEEKRKLHKFLFYLTLSSITAVFFLYIDIVMLGAFVKSEFIGYYRAAFGIMGAIAGLISITNILLPVFVQLEGERLERAFNKVLKYSAILAFPTAFGLALVSKPFINIIYGASYLQASIPLYLISFLIIETTFSSMFYWLFTAKELPKITTKILAYAAVMNIVLNLILISYFVKFGDIYAVIGAAIATIISRYFNLISLLIQAKKKLKIGIKLSNITKPLIASIVMFIALIIFQSLTRYIWPKSLIEIVFAAAVYFAVMIVIKGIKKEDFELFRHLF